MHRATCHVALAQRACSTHRQADSASLGAAYRALHGWRNRASVAGKRVEWIPFEEAVRAPGLTVAAQPDVAAHAVYASMLAHFVACEANAVAALV